MNNDMRLIIESLMKSFDELDDVRYRVLMREETIEDLQALLDNIDSQAAADVYRWLKQKLKLDKSNDDYKWYVKQYESITSFEQSQQTLKGERRW